MSLAPLIVATAVAAASRSTSGRSLFTLGLIAGAGYFGGAIYWVGAVMSTFGGLSSAVAVAVTILLVLYLAIYPGLFALLLGLAVRRFGVSGVWTAPAIWVATEAARGWVAGGFPWAILGTSQATVLPVAQLASVTGVYGLSALVALVSTATAVVVVSTARTQRMAAAAVGIVLVATAVSGAFRVSRSALTDDGSPLRVGLLQGNVPQDQKWDPAYREPILNRYLDLARRAIDDGADLVIWPEASTPFYLDLDAASAAAIRQLARDTATPMLVGTDDFEPTPGDEPDRIFNSAVLVDSNGQSRARYHKMYLVPFGEYVPFKDLLFFVSPLVEAVSAFTAGTEPVVFDVDGRRVSVSICYESIYPGLSRRFVARGSQLLATITNDAWFGRSSAAYQHWEQGALRAIEQGRYVVRSANTGISGAVDPYGRVLDATPLFETTVRTVDVRLLDHRTVYSRAGDVVVWASLALCLWLIWHVRPRRRVAQVA